MNEAGWTTVGTVGGLLIAAVVAGVLKLMFGRQKVRSLDRADLSSQWDDLFTKMRADLDRQAARIDAQAAQLADLNRERQDCERRLERFSVRQQYLEDMMTRAGITFVPFDPNPSEPYRRPQPPDVGGKSP